MICPTTKTRSNKPLAEHRGKSWQFLYELSLCHCQSRFDLEEPNYLSLDPQEILFLSLHSHFLFGESLFPTFCCSVLSIKCMLSIYVQSKSSPILEVKPMFVSFHLRRLTKPRTENFSTLDITGLHHQETAQILESSLDSVNGI